jgi:2-phospho-L-lactate/phosphoenolpyruvate guanylyltransferase
MTLWAIVPVKRLQEGKSRLAGCLRKDQRLLLSYSMILKTLNEIVQVKDINGIILISTDAKILEIAKEYGVISISENGFADLNRAIRMATDKVLDKRGESVVIIPTDLPFITKYELLEIIKSFRQSNLVLLIPDRKRKGTNIMLLTPPGIIQYNYGSKSFDAHRQSSANKNIKFCIHESNKLQLDIDTKNDYLHLVAVYRQEMP